ncbi:hypothetical protein ACQEVY_02515 [Streptomyces sp. CA-288835]|uniref:hypothetical protein n=1 Tax=Streptomyces sp. CA-288835 TaxID=3240069 RepID=UPI003D91AED7
MDARGSTPLPGNIVDGLTQAPTALAGLLRADNTGKTLVRIDDGAHREGTVD